MRTKTFRAEVDVSNQYLRLGTDPEGYVRAALERQLSGELTGPRGGRYEPVGEIEFLTQYQNGDDFMRNIWRFAARRQVRYVRPKR